MLIKRQERKEFGENGIIKMAQKAKEEPEKSTKNELDALNNLEGEMENAIKGNTSTKLNEWTQPDPLKPEITNGEITVKIGDYVDYNCKSSTATYTSPAEKSGHTEDQVFKANEYQYGWRVLGVDENKQLMLLSEDFAQPTTGGTALGVRQSYTLQGREGYTNGVEELNKICSIYGNGIGATSARVVTVDDINRITGYNPNNTGKRDFNKIEEGIKYYQGDILEYGNIVEYTLTTAGVKYEPTNSANYGTSNDYTIFSYYDEQNRNWKNLSTNESIVLESSSYEYYPTTLNVTNDITISTGIGIESKEYKMLFTNSSTGADTVNNGNNDNFYYWLGTMGKYTGTGYALFTLHCIEEGKVTNSALTRSFQNTGRGKLGVRPVVTLDKRVSLKDSGTMKDGCRLYNMSLDE